MREYENQRAKLKLDEEFKKRSEAEAKKSELAGRGSDAANFAGRARYVSEGIDLGPLYVWGTDEQLAHVWVCEVPPSTEFLQATRTGSAYERVVPHGRIQDIEIVTEDEIPEDCIAKHRLSDLRRMRAESLARSKRLRERRLPQGVPVGRKRS